MFNQKTAGGLLGISDNTFRAYADAIGLEAERDGRKAMRSIGDICLVKMGLDLVARGYSPTLATALVYEMKSEFHRLVVDEGRGASAWLFWHPSAGDNGDIVATIYRDAGDALTALEAAPDSTILPIHSMLRSALDALLAEVGGRG